MSRPKKVRNISQHDKTDYLKYTFTMNTMFSYRNNGRIYHLVSNDNVVLTGINTT